MELLSVKSVAEPILHSSPDEEVPKVTNQLHVENVLILNIGCSQMSISAGEFETKTLNPLLKFPHYINSIF